MGFDLGKWVRDGIIEGYKTGEFSFSYVTTLVAKHLTNGILTEADAAEIAQTCTPVAEIIEEELSDEADKLLPDEE